MSNKKPIAWHEECLRNSITTLNGLYMKRASLDATIERSAAAVERLRQQIEEAKKRGLDGFDFDRFMVPKKK